jgi:hypothetical protein
MEADAGSIAGTTAYTIDTVSHGEGRRGEGEEEGRRGRRGIERDGEGGEWVSSLSPLFALKRNCFPAWLDFERCRFFRKPASKIYYRGWFLINRYL